MSARGCLSANSGGSTGNSFSSGYDLPVLKKCPDRFPSGWIFIRRTRRRRDLDNLFKCLLDALQFGGAYSDDNQITQITATKREPLPPDGLVYIKLEPYVNDQISGPR